MKNPFNNLFSRFNLKTADGKKPTKIGYVLILGLLGLLLLLISTLFQEETSYMEPPSTLPDKEESVETEEETFLQKDSKSSDLEEIETQYEEDLELLLEEISGVSAVEVMVNLDATNKKIYEKNLIVGHQTTEEIDQNGGERNIEDATEEQQVVIVRQGEKEVPLLIQTKKPEVRGVLVVAKGVEHMELKQWVSEAVSRVLDVPAHRISIMPRNNGEE
ncbi:stage III sporulation protein AG [Paraliobacillus quinghaiensis]|uniref:Stage III sporulation protein AG n=1 Tax=Paraliobacillus quinghaiensis TaxID=470815 RepID=A0A917WWT7_9BACI|nr:stage III sporulation protein AG [Paraliobacillus quinghaiensis]GGM40243.1 stage III sporulation protein AG [Paraliobacillus quinghaiensis]